MAWTFSITSTRDPFKQSLGLQTMFHVVASFLVLGQVVSSLPRQARARSILWASLLVSYVPYLAHIDADKTAQLSLVRSQMHPVELLIQNAKRDFAALCRNQSQSLDAAQREYHRRYNQQPPPGFGTWYEFAKAHHSPMIDDFDMIYDTVSPFWKLSGEEFLEVITHAQNKVDADMWFCTVFGEKAKVQCEHPWRKFDRHLQDFLIKTLGGLRGISSEARFLVNHLDEPRVIIPPQLTKDQNGRWKYNLTDISGKPVWNALTKFCNFEGNTSITRSESQIETFGLPLVTNTLSAMDLCQHPEYSTSHGLVMSPVSFPLLEGFVPVLSTGAPSTMGDILFPSPAYAASEFQYDETRDVEWDQKRNNLYWAGSTTGGFAGNDQWPNFHRHRFVRLAQNLDRREHSYLTEKDGMISRVKSTFLNSRLFDVAFTRILHCKLKYCRDQHAYFDIKHWADKDEAFRSRLVFDIDGNGISGRYYKLLASKSVPLKQTILREWHDDRLMPWVHYIPVSQSMEELPDLVLYLTSTEAGQRQAKEIATQGREWFFKSFRPIDLTIYMYRLMLELARLQDPSRAASPAN